jgi:hypothetical protein
VLAGAGLAWLLYHRVSTVRCTSANWWLLGIALTVVLSSVLYSRFAYFWAKLVWLGTLMSLCWAARVHPCHATDRRPSVVDQGPRTEADGHWPREPLVEAAPVEGIESREAAVRLSVAQAILKRDSLWQANVPIVVHVPLLRVFDASGKVIESTEIEEIPNLLEAHPSHTVLLELHGGDEADTVAKAETLGRWLLTRGVRQEQFVTRGVGDRYPLLPTDGLGGSTDVNRRLEMRISAQR